jgi:hypothetical protein
MPMSLQQAAKQAIECQNACNLSGVLDSFHRVVMDCIWPEARKQGKGTDFVNTHPVVYLFLDKLTSLNHRQCLCNTNLDEYNKAYAEALRIADAVYSDAA